MTDDDPIEDLTFPDHPIKGDGVVTFPQERSSKVPSVDLPESVASQLLTETVGNIQANNRDGRGIATAALGSLQAGIAKTHNELGPAESRAVSGVMATPVAAPAVPQSS